MSGDLIQGSVTEALLLLAIVGLTLISTIDLLMHATSKREKNTDQER
jgi:hypothetical protein